MMAAILPTGSFLSLKARNSCFSACSQKGFFVSMNFTSKSKGATQCGSFLYIRQGNFMNCMRSEFVRTVCMRTTQIFLLRPVSLVEPPEVFCPAFCRFGHALPGKTEFPALALIAYALLA